MSEKEYKQKTEVLFARNTVLINENERLNAEVLELKEIIIDVFKKHGELCSLCENKGQKITECKCMKDEECLEHLIKLYKGGNK